MLIPYSFPMSARFVCNVGITLNILKNIHFTSSSFQTLCPVPQDRFHSVLQEFKGVFRQELDAILDTVKHDLVHHITTSGPPVSSRYRQLSDEKLKIAKKNFPWYGKARYLPQISWPMVLPSPYGAQKQTWRVEAMRWLQKTQRSNWTRSISNTSSCRLFLTSGGVKNIFLIRFAQWVSPDTG